MMAYKDAYNPANICENYIGQAGGSGTGTRMGFIVPEGTETWLLVFSEVYPPAGPCSYSFTISGFDCQ